MSEPSSDVVQPRIPDATYRVQMHKDFTFNQAREIVPYLRELGISDLYTSPFFQASPGSNHGYDIVDHNHLNAEIGTEAEFDAMIDALHRQQMGLVADFVPNHMGIAESVNGWWMDVLENGPSSLAAACFDIDWHPLKPELENKVLLPILGDQYGRVLEKGELKLAFETGAFFLYYYANKLPINPRTYNLILQAALAELGPTNPSVARLTVDQPVLELESIMTQLQNMPLRTSTDREQIAQRAREKEIAKHRLEQLAADNPPVAAAIERALESFQGQPDDVRSFDAMHQLIEAQAYRLSYWRVAAEEINYRRFFDINTLAAIRVELPEVFEATHQLLWRLVERGAVTGLRIDHPDGLYDPRGYFTQLQETYARLMGKGLPESGKGMYLLAEKILSGDEKLREDWPIDGTTGYDFTTQITALLVDPTAEALFSETYEKFIRRNVHFPTLIYEKKRLVMRLSLANDINVLGSMLNRLSERNRRSRDYTLNSLTTAVREVVAAFPVYRTYLTPGQPPSEEDLKVLDRAVRLAKRLNPGIEASIFDFLRDILSFKFPEGTDEAGVAEHERFVMKFQQCTGPIMAKGLEDTSFYIYNRLTALNEVGGEPDHFGATPADFHAACDHRQRCWPHAMLATSTHDTKRSEDTRARIAVLSETPRQWRKALRGWGLLNRKEKTSVEGEPAPSANEEYLLYQVLLGMWPMPLEEGKSAFASLSEAEHADFVTRVQEYMTKAIKEAKVNSSWIQPNEPWDEAVRKFITALLRRGKRANHFVRSFEPMAADVARYGVVNSLSQTVLKLTVPGVPDIYQGNEIWDFSLVDPDNRRPVDYALRRQMLGSLKDVGAAELLHRWQDGRLKLSVTQKVLRYRNAHPELFRSGTYQPLKVEGKYADSVVAFQREQDGTVLVVVVPRLASKVGFPPVGSRWLDTAITLEPAVGGGVWRELFTGRQIDLNAVEGSLPLAEILAEFPLAVLTREG